MKTSHPNIQSLDLAGQVPNNQLGNFDEDPILSLRKSTAGAQPISELNFYNDQNFLGGGGSPLQYGYNQSQSPNDRQGGNDSMRFSAVSGGGQIRP